MKNGRFALMLAVCLMAALGLCALSQWQWEAQCTWYTADDTAVYIPGTVEVATTLPAGTSIRAEETVGDAWQAIEYMIGGKCHTGMVRAGTLVQRGNVP